LGFPAVGPSARAGKTTAGPRPQFGQAGSDATGAAGP
jgi:hypothetical protein